MSPTTKLARRRTLPLPMIFGQTRLPDLVDLMDNLEFFPEVPELAQFIPAGLFPAVNIVEESARFVVTAELPGLTEKDVKIDFTDGVLTIKGEKADEHSLKENGNRYHIWERRYGSVQRSFPVPGGIADDKITADFKDGLLTVYLSKAPVEHEKGRSIKINAK